MARPVALLTVTLTLLLAAATVPAASVAARCDTDAQVDSCSASGVVASSDALTEWPVVMATAILAMLPPVGIVVIMQKLFVRGLVETEK